MTADVVSLDAARASRARADRRSFDPGDPDYWRADLERFPRAFRRRLRPYLARVHEGAFSGPGFLHATPHQLYSRRLREPLDYSHHFALSMVSSRLLLIRTKARQYCAARNARRRSDVVRRRRVALRSAQDELLWVLWSLDVRDLRDDLEGEARLEVVQSLEGARADRVRLEGWLAVAAERLARGRYASGRLKGRWYTKARCAALTREVQNLERCLAACRARVAVLEGESSPLHALGFYGGRRRVWERVQGEGARDA